MLFRKFYNQNVAETDFFAKKFGLSPQITELILSRGFSNEQEIEEFLNPKVFHSPLLLKGMDKLKDRIFLAKELKDRVLIFGDYDVDGISATAIMLKTLEKLGIKANYYLPNRYKDGYGLTCDVIDKVIRLFDPQLIITVDCGISCYKEVEYAKNKGVDIIVTDHHEIPDIIPDTIVLNAKMDGQEYPFKELCGTGLAYKISEALIGEKAEEFLPIACIATISDIVPLVDENRTIVTKGLKLFNKFLPVGLKMLIVDSKLDPNTITSSEISFKISPKINAAGRMGDAADSLQLYIEKDVGKIKKYIEKIKEHNAKRQEICNDIYEDCEKALKKINIRDIRVISLASKKWDQGVLGIVCSRLVEKYHKPTFLFAQVGDDLHGSGRSIDDINIHELLSSLKDILETYGGHSMAAGLTLKRSNYEEFSKRVNAFVMQKVDDKVFIPISYYDQELKLDDINEKFIKDLEILEPVGCANPKPRFKISSNEVTINPMKKFAQHANVKIGDLDLVYFNYLNKYNKIMFSKQKNFIFEFQGKGKKGIVLDFDGGSFLKDNVSKEIEAIELQQLLYTKKNTIKYNMYSTKNLLQLVTKTLPTVFGTAFVAFSVSDYINFVKKYTLEGIYDYSFCDSESTPYNSILLAPLGINWAKNFNKIVFLSPILDEGYIEAINSMTDAEIYIPLDKKSDNRKFEKLDLSRNTFAKIYTRLSHAQNKSFGNVFDLYNFCFPNKEIKFVDFYSAINTFSDLSLIDVKFGEKLEINIEKKDKMLLTSSSFYNKLNLLKNIMGSDNESRF